MAKISFLTPEIYQQHLSKRHIFVVACTQADSSCQKVQDDFEDEWKRFDKQNRSDFASALFVLIRNQDNAEFYTAFTNGSAKHLIVYVEEAEQEQKQIIDPFALSQRALREWLREVEVIYADKKINEKIAELDIMINNLQDPNYLASVAQLNQLKETLNVSDDTQTEESTSSSGNSFSFADDSQPAVAEPLSPERKRDDFAAVLALPSQLVQDATPSSPEISAQKLQSKIDDEEVTSNLERNLNIHQIKINTLNVKEQQLVKEYLQEESKQKQASVPSVASQTVPVSPISVLPQPFSQASALSKQLALSKIDTENFSAQDIDLAKLSTAEVDVVVNYINKRRSDEKKRQEQISKARVESTISYVKAEEKPAVVPDSTKIINLTSVATVEKGRFAALFAKLQLASLSEGFMSSTLYISLTIAVTAMTSAAILHYLTSRRKKGYVSLSGKLQRIEDI